MLSGLVGLDGLVPDASWLDDFELEEGIKRLQATGRSATFIVRATMSEEREDVVQPVACQSRGSTARASLVSGSGVVELFKPV